MSTDTAFALGLLTLFGRRAPDRLRAFMLTVVIADDLLALVVIALVYSDSIDLMPLIWAAGLFAVALVMLRGLELRRGLPYLVLAGAMWVAALESGVEPLVVGLAFGLLVWATPAARSDLEHAGRRFREFREQPTPELQRVAHESIRTAISPNERLQLIYHPWTSYVIVPLFALANAGIAIDGDFLERAAGSPITLGVLVGYVAGKPLGIVGTALLVTWLSRGRLRPTAGWGAVAGAGASAGVGFTVSLLVATLAFDGAQLEEAKAGILAAPVGAAAVTWWCSAPSDCCRSGAVLPPCSAAQSRSSTSSSRSIPSRTTSAVRSTRR
jgi:Na+/H+ antiporter NhaA